MSLTGYIEHTFFKGLLESPGESPYFCSSMDQCLINVSREKTAFCITVSIPPETLVQYLTAHVAVLGLSQR